MFTLYNKETSESEVEKDTTGGYLDALKFASPGGLKYSIFRYLASGSLGNSKYGTGFGQVYHHEVLGHSGSLHVAS